MSGKIFHAHVRGARLKGLRVLVVAATTVLSIGCAGNNYMGIPLVPENQDSVVQNLARRARGGDKQAQLDLGVRFERGNGVQADIQKAEELYAMSATDSSNSRMLYIPVDRHIEASPVSLGKRALGLPEAKKRLNKINNIKFFQKTRSIFRCPAAATRDDLVKRSHLIIRADANAADGHGFDEYGYGNQNVILHNVLVLKNLNKLNINNIVFFSYPYLEDDECGFNFSSHDKIFYFISEAGHIFIIKSLEE